MARETPAQRDPRATRSMARDMSPVWWSTPHVRRGSPVGHARAPDRVGREDHRPLAAMPCVDVRRDARPEVVLATAVGTHFATALSVTGIPRAHVPLAP